MECPCVNTESDASMKSTPIFARDVVKMSSFSSTSSHDLYCILCTGAVLHCEEPNYRISGGVAMSIF
jgi:hypothetical protein